MRTGIEAIAIGREHACGLFTNHGVRCWGDNTYGQLGYDTAWSRWKPEPSDVLGEVRSIAVGPYHSCAVSMDGSPRCWGKNDAGHLGDGSQTKQTTPTGVLLADIQAVALGEWHTCALRRDVFSGAISIATGGSVSCAITASHGLRCWGTNQNGQFGDGYERFTPLPAVVQALCP